MLWYIMHACVIMHNMIIENERGQDLDYSQYELLGYPVRVRRRAERVARFIVSYHAIRRPATQMNFRNQLKSGGHDMDDKEHDDICIRHCIVHELFVVFIALFVVLNDKLFV